MNFSKLGQSLTAKEILDLVQDDLRKVEREIGIESMASGTVVSTISQHLNGNGGKRLRPILLLLSAKLVGETNPSCIHLGAVVEMIHTATWSMTTLLTWRKLVAASHRAISFGAIARVFSRAIGCTCRPFRSLYGSGIFTSSIFSSP